MIATARGSTTTKIYQHPEIINIKKLCENKFTEYIISKIIFNKNISVKFHTLNHNLFSVIKIMTDFAEYSNESSLVSLTTDFNHENEFTLCCIAWPRRNIWPKFRF